MGLSCAEHCQSNRLSRTATLALFHLEDLQIMAVEPADSETASIAYASVEQLLKSLDAGDLTCERLMSIYLSRIEGLDQTGPRINAMISLNPQAVLQARAADLERKTGTHCGVLHGIPFIVKDNFDVAGMVTSGGSFALRDATVSSTSTMVQCLLDQGAILVGKANMSELAASCGWLSYSSLGGLTLNPYNTARNVSGSSGGSAAALAAGFAAFALGTDSSGSIRAPASVTGLVGLRPTQGLIEGCGIIPLTMSFDTAGPMTRSVRDMVLILDVIAGPDPTDARPVQPLDSSALKSARLGVVSNFRGANPEVDHLEQEVLERLQSAGATLLPIKLPPAFERLWTEVLEPVGLVEFKPQIERYLKEAGNRTVDSLDALIGLSESLEALQSETPINPVRLKELHRANQANSQKLLTRQAIVDHLIPALRTALITIFEELRLDALIFPTLNCPASPRFDRHDPSWACNTDDTYKACYIAAAVGFPEISVPAGRVEANLPVGCSFLGLPRQERLLLSLAEGFQAIIGHLAPPDL